MRQVNKILLPSARLAALNGARKLRALLQPNGKFIYSHDYLTGTAARKEYNLLRHCGSLWALLVCRQHFSGDLNGGDYLRAVQSGLDWLWQHHVVAQDNRALVVWKDYIKLGGNALALLAISEFIRAMLAAEFRSNSTWQIKHHEIWLERAENLALGLHFLRQGPEGDFIHKMSALDGSVADFRSDYYTGEALFALGHWRTTCQQLVVHGRAIDKFPSYLLYPDACQLLLRLARQNYGLEFQSHWMCYAVSQEITARQLPNADVAELQEYLEALVNDIVARPDYRRRRKANPIACRSEALLAAWPLYQSEKIQNTIDVNIMLQLQWVRENGAIVESDKNTEVRIDTVQHGICAFANYARLMT